MDALLHHGGNFALSDADLSLDTGATTYDTANTLNFTIGGQHYNKTAVTNGATPTTQADGKALATIGVSQGCALVWVINAAGTVGVLQGDVTGLDATNAFSRPDAAHFPGVPDAWCAFAYVIMRNGSTGSTFTIGVSNWDATGMTTGVYDVRTLPLRPQAA